MSHFVVNPEASRVWIEGSSSVHPIHATASGLVGWVDLSRSGDEIARDPDLGGEIRIAVDRLASGNALVDRETRRRIDARHHPEIIGTVSTAERIGKDLLAVSGDISFRGRICSVSGEIAVSWEGERLVLEGERMLDVRDWELQPPRVALLRVHPDVRVRIRIEADPTR